MKFCLVHGSVSGMKKNRQNTQKRIRAIVKNYQKWMIVKSKINNSKKIRRINEGDVLWAAIGENVGVEIDGKSDKYSRPVVVLKKHSNLCFTGIPLTSQLHEGTWYSHFIFQGKRQTAVLIQTKLMDVRRVYSRIGELSKADYSKLLDDYISFLRNKNMP